MLTNLFRIGERAQALDSTYFKGTAVKNSFREDLRAVLGCALVLAFITAAITGSISTPLFLSDGTLTTIAFFVGGIVGKVAL